MTEDELNKGKDIQCALSGLKSELIYLENERNVYLRGLVDTCSKEVMPLLASTEKAHKKYLRNLIETKIKELEKEFKAL